VVYGSDWVEELVRKVKRMGGFFGEGILKVWVGLC
jgi:hypothetical protein